MDLHCPAERRPPGAAGLGRDPAAADPVDLLRAGGRGHPRLRRHRRAAVREPLLRPTSGARTPPSAARSTPSSGWPPSSGCPWPTSSGTASSAGPPNARWSSPDLHRRLRRPVRDLALHAPPVDGGDPAVPGQRGGVPAGHLHLPDPGGHRPGRDAHHLLRHVRGLLAGLRRLRRRRPPRRRQRRRRLPERSDRGPHPHRPGLCHRRDHAVGRLPLRAARHHPGHRGRPRALRRGPAPPGRRGPARPPDPQPRLLLRLQPGAVRHQPGGGPGRDRGPARAPTGPASRRCCGPCPASTIPTGG